MTKFVLARLTETEARTDRDARSADPDVAFRHLLDVDHVWSSCAARREIVADLTGEWLSDAEDNWFVLFLLHELAVPYANHPDYDPAWRAAGGGNLVGAEGIEPPTTSL